MRQGARHKVVQHVVNAQAPEDEASRGACPDGGQGGRGEGKATEDAWRAEEGALPGVYEPVPDNDGSDAGNSMETYRRAHESSKQSAAAVHCQGHASPVRGRESGLLGPDRTPSALLHTAQSPHSEGHDRAGGSQPALEDQGGARQCHVRQFHDGHLDGHDNQSVLHLSDRLGPSHVTSILPILPDKSRAFVAPATSVYSERLFSEMGNLYEKKRSCLRPDVAENLLFLHHNLAKMSDNAPDKLQQLRDRDAEEQAADSFDV